MVKRLRPASPPGSPSVPQREQADNTQLSEHDAAATPRRADRAGYLAFVAHEMRNPLSTALWSAELLTRMSPEDRAGARGEKLAGMCLRTLARLRHLVEDHFLAERLAIRGIPVRVEAVPLGDALAAAVARVAGAVCEAQLAGVTMQADRAMLERALEALVAAAAHEGAAVRVTARQQDGQLELRVEGAPPLEGAFRSPDRSTPSDPTGRALGLLMARSVAESHGGSLDLDGGAYLLAFPLEEPPAGEER